MSTVKQAITGVSAGTEAEVMVKFPSVSSQAPGRLIGKLLECCPVRIPLLGVKISHIVFGPLCAPMGAIGYFVTKVFGEKYVLTNHAIRKWKFIGSRMLSQVDLADIADIAIFQQSGQEFFKAADLHLLNANGDVLMRIEGIPRAEVFRDNILTTRDSRLETQSSLATIESRQTA